MAGKNPQPTSGAKKSDLSTGGKKPQPSDKRGGKQHDDSGKVISDIYVHKVPLFERWQKSYESSNVAKSYEKERMEEIKERMRRIEAEEICEHSKRFDSALKMREHNKSKLMEEFKMDPHLVKFMKEYNEGNNDYDKTKKEKTQRRQEMFQYVKEAKARQLSAIEQKRFNRGLTYNSQQNLYLRDKTKMKEKLTDYKKYIKETLDPLRKDQRDRLIAKTPRGPTALSSLVEPSTIASKAKTLSARPAASASQVIMPRVANHDEVKAVQTKLRHLSESSTDAAHYVAYE